MARPLPTKRWTRLQYDRLIECGVFQPGDRVELIGGELIVREPQRTPDSTAIEIADYWLVNLVDHVLEVYRDPVAAPASPYGWRYASVTTLRGADVVTPLAAPRSRLAVADLLP
jgi:hypothetical protein